MATSWKLLNKHNEHDNDLHIITLLEKWKSVRRLTKLSRRTGATRRKMRRLERWWQLHWLGAASSSVRLLQLAAKSTRRFRMGFRLKFIVWRRPIPKPSTKQIDRNFSRYPATLPLTRSITEHFYEYLLSITVFCRWSIMSFWQGSPRQNSEMTKHEKIQSACVVTFDVCRTRTHTHAHTHTHTHPQRRLAFASNSMPNGIIELARTEMQTRKKNKRNKKIIKCAIEVFRNDKFAVFQHLNA